MRQRDFVPTYAPGVTLGTSRKMKQERGRIVDNRLNRAVKWTWCRIVGSYGHLSGLCVLTEALWLFQVPISAGRELCWNPDLECRPPDGRDVFDARTAPLHMPPAQTCWGMYFNTDSLRFFVALDNVNTA